MSSIDIGREQAPLLGRVDGNLEDGSATGPAVRGIYERVSGPTLASTWYAASGAPVTDRLLDWPPDVFALTNVVLARAEAFRFALSATDWPPSRFDDWAQAVEEAGRRWSAWAEDRTGPLPDLVAAEWSVVCEGAEVPLERLALGRDHRLRDALLTLHAIADEACAGLGVALDSSGAEGCVYRARGRELLARTGSLARTDVRMLRVLPKVITPPTGRPAFSRYACVQGPASTPGGTRSRPATAVQTFAPSTPRSCCCRGRCECRHRTSARWARCGGWPSARTGTSSSPRPKGSTLTCWTGCWWPPAKRRAASMS